MAGYQPVPGGSPAPCAEAGEILSDPSGEDREGKPAFKNTGRGDRIYKYSSSPVRQAPGKRSGCNSLAVDGVAEAMESPEGRIVLVQWHPEELTRSVPKMNGLFSDLVRKAQRHRCEKQQES